MPTNINKIKEKIGDVASKTKQSAIWKPSKPKNIVRIVPYNKDKECPFVKLFFHYEVNDGTAKPKTVLSPATFGDPDPFAEAAQVLQQTGDNDDWKMAKALVPKERIFAPIIVRGEQNKGVLWMSLGVKTYDQIIKIMQNADEQGIDIVDVKKGVDLVVEVVSKEQSKTNYSSTTITPRQKQSQLSDDPEQVKTWLEEQPDIFDVYKRYTYEQLQAMLDNFGKPINQNKKDDTEVENQTSQKERKMKSRITRYLIVNTMLKSKFKKTTV